MGRDSTAAKARHASFLALPASAVLVFLGHSSWRLARAIPLKKSNVARLVISHWAAARFLAQWSELKALKAQINPHFLYNSLHSISALTAAAFASRKGLRMARRPALSRLPYCLNRWSGNCKGGQIVRPGVELKRGRRSRRHCREILLGILIRSPLLVPFCFPRVGPPSSSSGLSALLR